MSAYEKLYYSPKGYWKGESAVVKLAEKTNTSQVEAKKMAIKASNLASIFT